MYTTETFSRKSEGNDMDIKVSIILNWVFHLEVGAEGSTRTSVFTAENQDLSLPVPDTRSLVWTLNKLQVRG